MSGLLKRIADSPALARALPFIIFVVLTSLQGKFGESSRYWLYFAKTILGGWMLWVLRDAIREMKWVFSWEAVVAGVLVFVLWVGLDGHYPTLNELFKMIRLDKLLAWIGLGSSEEKEVLGWNPLEQFSNAPALAWMFIVMRIFAISVVVPPLEEIFYRSFLYRYIAKPDFENIPLGKFLPVPFAIMCLLFGLAHFEWLAGILCGAIYGGLICWKKRLGDAITAHAITNFILGIYVVWKQQWHFW